MILLSNQKFKDVLENRFRIDFDDILEKNDETLADHLRKSRGANFIDMDLYGKLFSFLEPYEIDSFHRFFSILLRKYWDETICVGNPPDLSNLDIFTLYIATLQYYFT